MNEQEPSDNRKLRLLANELLFTSYGATMGAIGAAIVSSGIVFPAVGSVIGGIVGFLTIKIIREIQIRDIKRKLEEDGLKKKAKPIKKEDIKDWLRSLLD